MRVLCLLPEPRESIPRLAEACLVFTPQISVSDEAIFLEIGASGNLFSEADCVRELGHILHSFGMKARLALADDIPTSLAFARHQIFAKEELSVEALADFIQPFSPEPFLAAAHFRRLGIDTVGALLRLPRRELASRFGKEALLALERIYSAKGLPWPRFTPPELVLERADFDCAAQIETLEPVLFLVKTVLGRAFTRLLARRKKLVAFDLLFHFDRFSRIPQKTRGFPFRFPTPQSEAQAVLRVIQERLHAELAKHPLEDALEGVSFLAVDTAPFLDAQKDFFTRAEEEKEAVGSLMARLKERLGDGRAFFAQAMPRRLPEASWRRTEQPAPHTVIPTPTRPLRIFSKPEPLQRRGDRLHGKKKSWRILKFEGPEKLSGEWWLNFFEREYFRVVTEEEDLWVFRSRDGLYLHGVFD